MDRRHISACCAHGEGDLLILDDHSIPASLKADAEQVRAHLVFLRGGAPFLSPADALCLVEWLEEGLPLHVILTALERCVASRRRTRAKRPLTLRAAKRHLHKAPLEPVTLRPGGHPFAPVSDQLRASAAPGSQDLAVALTALPVEDSTALVSDAVTLCREVQEMRWADLSETERASRIATAHDEMGDLANIVDAVTLDTLCEEIAREAFRAQWPRLDTATFSTLATS